MNINIAFNTIIYIMVFLFPGILFRRAFFSGKFKRHFDSGNSFERILWGILLSIVCISLFITCIILLRQYSPDTVHSYLTFSSQTIIDNFVNIYNNKFPDILRNKSQILEASYLLASIYVFSLVLGFSSHAIIFILGLEKTKAFLQFQNTWHYLTVSNSQNNNKHKIGDIYYTRVDIKTSEGQLFTGELHDIILDKEGKIDAVAMRETYKFISLNKLNDAAKINELQSQINSDNLSLIMHLETSLEFIFKKRIKGHVFTIFNDHIENISITFVKISHIGQRFQKLLKIILSLMIYLIVLFSITYMFWDLQIFAFNSTIRRVVFCITIPINFLLLVLLIINIASYGKKAKRKYLIDLKDSASIFIFSILPHFYAFGFISFGRSIIYFLLCFVLLGLILSIGRKNDATE